MAVLEVKGLRKAYGPVVAVDGVSFAVEAGEILGVVGPNGAGKTTTLECAEGLRRPDAGQIRVLGLDPQADGYALRERVGVQLQQAALPDRLKVWEALDLFSSFYRRPADPKELLERLGLTAQAQTVVTKLSGGQRQRVHIAMALLNQPELVFFDELTTGLDPQARRATWDLVRDVRDGGKTVVLTTHFMEEAERLCDRVAIMDRGKVVALDTPSGLVRRYASEERITFVATTPCPVERLRAIDGVTAVEVAKGEAVRANGNGNSDQVTVFGTHPQLVGEVVAALTAGGVGFRDLSTTRSTLDDVFLALTGRQMRD